MRYRLGAAFAAMLAMPAAAGAAEEPLPFACVPPLAPAMTAASLAAAFGEENLLTGSMMGPEGETFVGTVLYPKDQKRRLVIAWGDEAAHTQPISMAVTLPSNWVTPEGLRVGMDLAEIVRLNGERFQIYGFGWDYGGLATFEAGRLAKPAGGCALEVFFDAAPDAPITKVIGEVLFWSDDPDMQAARPASYEMRLRFGE